MKRLMLAAAIAAMTTGGAAFTETLTEYEARADTTQDGMYLLFVSRPVSEDSPMGDAFMILGKGDTVTTVAAEINYGLRIVKGIPTLAEVSDDDAAAIRGSEGPQPTLVSAVRVDEDQYDRLKTLLGEWSTKTEFDIAVGNAALDCTQDAVDIVGFKRPYRAGLLAPHVMNYYSDIQITNRKSAV